MVRTTLKEGFLISSKKGGGRKHGERNFTPKGKGQMAIREDGSQQNRRKGNASAPPTPEAAHRLEGGRSHTPHNKVKRSGRIKSLSEGTSQSDPPAKEKRIPRQREGRRFVSRGKEWGEGSGGGERQNHNTNSPGKFCIWPLNEGKCLFHRGIREGTGASGVCR